MKKIIFFIKKAAYNHNLLLLAVIFSGLMLRLYRLNYKNIWYDEACSVGFVHNNWDSLLSHRYLLRPLYFIFLKGWTEIFGYREVALRLPSVIFGVCAIFLIYLVAKELFNEKTGLISALLLAMSGYHVIRSQDARGYALLMLIVLIGTYVFLKALNNKPRYYPAYSIIMILMFLTNFFAAFIIFCVHNLFFLFKKGVYNCKRWLLFQVLILAFSALIIFPGVKYYYLEQYNDKLCQGEYENVNSYMLEDFSYARKISQGGIGYYGIGDIPLRRKANYYLIIGVFMYTLLKYFKKNINKKKLISKQMLFLFYWFFIPAAVFSVVNFFIPISKWSKSAIIILPAFYILISIALTALSKRFLLVYLSVYIFLSFFSLSYVFSPADNSSWREMADYVKENIEDNEVIFFAPQHLISPFWYYYKYDVKFSLRNIGDGDCGQFYRMSGKWKIEFKDNTNLIKGVGFEKVDDVFWTKELSDGDYKGIWLVTCPWVGEGNMNKLIEIFSKFYRQEWGKEFPWNSVKVYHFMRRE